MSAADPHAVLADDPDLGPVVAEHGPLSLEPADDLFRRLVVAIVRQQISMDAAAAIIERLEDEFAVTPERMGTVAPERLEAVGLSHQKATCVRQAARAFEDDRLKRSALAEKDTDAVLETVSTIDGIGPWTAKMFAMFGLGRPDVFPVEDLGVRRGMELVCGTDGGRAAMVERAEPWRPYRSYAALYLWAAYEA